MSKNKELPINITVGLLFLGFIIPLWTFFVFFLYSKFVGIFYYLITTAIISPIFFMKRQFKELLAIRLFFTSTIFLLNIIGMILLFITFLLQLQIRIRLELLLLFLSLTYFGYFGLVLQFYLEDFFTNKKKRLKSFNFDDSTYDWKTRSLLYENAFSDFYFKSSLSKIHIFIIRWSFAGIATGSLLALIIGKISTSLQFSFGLFAIHLTLMFMIQLFTPSVYSLLQVVRLQIKHKKTFKIINA